MSGRLQKSASALAVLLFLSVVGPYLFLWFETTTSFRQLLIPTAFGDDDDDDDEDDADGSSKTIYVTEYQERQVSRIVVVTPPEYRTDSDGDGLVDAIDPEPRRRQQEYFTDTDGDSVADAFDMHHDEDDFLYDEAGTDTDGNGIIDSYEGL